MQVNDRTPLFDSQTCPSKEQIADWLAGELDEDQRELVNAHLGSCRDCRDRLRAMTAFLFDRTDADNRRNLSKQDPTVTPMEVESCPACGTSLNQTVSPKQTITSRVKPTDSSLQATVILDTVHRVSLLEQELPEIPGYICEEMIGRGGMGVVYRARQTALNRPVALKMIVTGRHATVQQLARFHIEAEALACLTHENIVQIYEFGEHESGPYLALELVEGDPLDVMLREKTYTPKEAARLCLLLARAMHLAHSRGVVHRDLKPANILLTKTGQPKITDFGLAKRLSEDSKWTKTDSVMGTPYYMAPEQAQGDTHAVGPLADVYSLGTVMYELLTGDPPFTGENMAELLNQICHQPPKSIRRLKPEVPKDLETICLRCLEKDGGKRYQTAEDLAGDLERFLENRPILARPIGPVERIGKWVKRRPAIAALLLGLVTLLIVIAVGGVAYNVQLRKERDLVEENFQLATKAVDEILDDLDQETLLMEPHAEERREELLRSALAFSKKLAAQKPQSVQAQRSLGFCQRRLGDIYRMMGEHDEAQAAYQEAIGLLSELRETNPTDEDVSMQLAAAHGFLGELQRQTSQMAEARDSYTIALELYDDLQTANPDEPDYQAESARVLYNLSILQKDTAGGESDPNRADRLNQARGSLGQSIEKLATLIEQHPEDRHYAQHLARSYINLGSVMRLQRALRKGRATYQLAISQLEELSERYPNFAEYRADLALAHSNLGNLLQDDKQFSEAVAEYRLAEEILTRVVEDHPKVPLYRKELANIYNSLGALNYREQDLQATGEAWESGIKLYETLIRDFPEVPDYHGGLGMTHSNLGHVLLESGLKDSLTLQHLETGLSELRIALRANPDQPGYLQSARTACGNLAVLLKENTEPEEALRVGEELLKGAETNPVDAQLAADYAARLLKEMGSDQEAAAWQEKFQHFAALAVEAFRKTPQGETALQTSSRYEPLRGLLDSP